MHLPLPLAWLALTPNAQTSCAQLEVVAARVTTRCFVAAISSNSSCSSFCRSLQTVRHGNMNTWMLTLQAVQQPEKTKCGLNGDIIVVVVHSLSRLFAVDLREISKEIPSKYSMGHVVLDYHLGGIIQTVAEI